MTQVTETIKNNLKTQKIYNLLLKNIQIKPREHNLKYGKRL